MESGSLFQSGHPVQIMLGVSVWLALVNILDTFHAKCNLYALMCLKKFVPNLKFRKCWSTLDLGLQLLLVTDPADL